MKELEIHSAPTRGRTLDHAALIYDTCEPILILGKQAEYDRRILSLLDLKGSDRVLDLGCGTGVLTRMMGDQLSAAAGGIALGIDAVAKMVKVARKKRQSATCRFEVVAAERLPYEDASFDAVVSSLFFHQVDLDLKVRALAEAFRVLHPKGKLVIVDMHTPSTMQTLPRFARWFGAEQKKPPKKRESIPCLSRILF